LGIVHITQLSPSSISSQRLKQDAQSNKNTGFNAQL